MFLYISHLSFSVDYWKNMSHTEWDEKRKSLFLALEKMKEMNQLIQWTGLASFYQLRHDLISLFKFYEYMLVRCSIAPITWFSRPIADHGPQYIQSRPGLLLRTSARSYRVHIEAFGRAGAVLFQPSLRPIQDIGQRRGSLGEALQEELRGRNKVQAGK